MTKTSFCGIFATLFVTTTMVLLASCSQDDDYYDSDMYTLAEMGTRLGGGGDPGSGGPAPVNINVPDKVIREFHEMYFYPDSIFYSSDFQHSPFTAIDPSLYSGYYVEADVWVDMQKIDGTPEVSSFAYISSQPSFTVDDVFLAPDETVTLPGRYILYATGNLLEDDGSTTCFTAFIPNRIYN